MVEGKDYRNIEPRELRRKLGLVTQRPYLFPGTVADNLRFGPAQRGETLGPEAIQELLAQVGLKDYAGRDVANLSGGEAQRVSVARTLANSPLVLLLDEPTSALDEAAKLEVESAIQKVMREQGLTCVVVTHDAAQAARLARRALVLESDVLSRSRSSRGGPSCLDCGSTRNYNWAWRKRWWPPWRHWRLYCWLGAAEFIWKAKP